MEPKDSSRIMTLKTVTRITRSPFDLLMTENFITILMAARESEL